MLSYIFEDTSIYHYRGDKMKEKVGRTLSIFLCMFLLLVAIAPTAVIVGANTNQQSEKPTDLTQVFVRGEISHIEKLGERYYVRAVQLHYLYKNGNKLDRSIVDNQEISLIGGELFFMLPHGSNTMVFGIFQELRIE